MGFGKVDNGETDTFHPDDTPATMYVQPFVELDDLLKRINSKWPGAKMYHIRITPERIQTTYPGYNSGVSSPEYSEFLKVTNLNMV